VKTSALELWAMLRAAAERRVGALLSAAWRARKLATGSTQARVALEAARAELLIVATDARAVAQLPWVEQAVAQGRALAWGTKDLLGSCARRSETGVVAVLDRGFADALRAAIAMDQLALPQAARRSRRSSAQRLTEDR
jgi:ribosomal protein L7Ae-like RNA K-turn-binding protein